MRDSRSPAPPHAAVSTHHNNQAQSKAAAPTPPRPMKKSPVGHDADPAPVKAIHLQHPDDDPKANVRIETSDGVYFAVWDYRLKAASVKYSQIFSKVQSTKTVFQWRQPARVVRPILDIVHLPFDNLHRLCLATDIEASYIRSEIRWAQMDNQINILERLWIAYLEHAPVEGFIWGCQLQKHDLARSAIAMFSHDMAWGDLVDFDPVPWGQDAGKLANAIGPERFAAYVRACRSAVRIASMSEGNEGKSMEWTEENMDWTHAATEMSFTDTAEKSTTEVKREDIEEPDDVGSRDKVAEEANP